MIKDNIKNASLYESVHPLFKQAFDFAKNLKSYEKGKVIIDGKNLYVNINKDMPLNEINNEKWEAHRQYIDIHYIIKGAEKCGVADIANFSKGNGYNTEKDVEFFTGTGNEDMLTVNEHEFVVVFPQDVHLPACLTDGFDKADKLVIKIKV